MRELRAALLCAALACIASSTHAEPPRLALIVDDIGYSLERGQRVIALPGPLAVAVLPFTPHAGALAKAAQRQGKDVILHQPMQSWNDPRSLPGTLTAEMPIDAFRRTLLLAFDELPQAVGVSNHTGSLLTARREQMNWLMAEVHTRGLLFVDSRTTTQTVALEAAIASGVPSVRRDVFLDHVVEPSAIAASFERAIDIARLQGHAVLIAHPHDSSLALLEWALPTLAERGISQVRLAEITSPSR